MIVSSKDRDLDGMRLEDGQSVRSFVFGVLGRIEPQQDVEILDAPDFAVVRNYVCTFSANKGRKYRAMIRTSKGITSLVVRRDY